MTLVSCVPVDSKAPACTVTVGNEALPDMTPETQLQVLISFMFCVCVFFKPHSVYVTEETPYDTTLKHKKWCL